MRISSHLVFCRQRPDWPTGRCNDGLNSGSGYARPAGEMVRVGLPAQACRIARATRRCGSESDILNRRFEPAIHDLRRLGQFLKVEPSQIAVEEALVIADHAFGILGQPHELELSGMQPELLER